MSFAIGIVEALQSALTTGLSRQLSITTRGQVRVSSESAVDAVAISIGGGDQTLAIAARGVFVGGSGNLVCRLVGATADITFTGLSAGQFYPFAISIIRQTGTTITNGVALL